MEFKTGDKAYFAAQGVGIVRDVETKVVGGTSFDFYIIQVISSGVKLMIPITTAEKSGMRQLIGDEEINKVYSILKSQGKVSQTTWNRRHREYNEKLRTGAASDIAEVLRDLYALKSFKELSNGELSDGEKEVLKKAKSLIVEEISYAKNIEEDDVHTKLDSILIN